MPSVLQSVCCGLQHLSGPVEPLRDQCPGACALAALLSGPGSAPRRQGRAGPDPGGMRAGRGMGLLGYPAETGRRKGCPVAGVLRGVRRIAELHSGRLSAGSSWRAVHPGPV